MFGLLHPLQNWVRQRSAKARELEARDDPLAQLPMDMDPAKLAGQVVLVGYGQIGQAVAATLQAQRISYVVAEDNRDTVEKLRAMQVPAVAGDVCDPAVLIQAHIARAAVLVITLSDSLRTRQMVAIARELNPGIKVVAHGVNASEAALLREDTQGEVLEPDQVLADGLAQQVVAWVGR
jgi:CPA2 family monovalent cation:H+ antiporter-2